MTRRPAVRGPLSWWRRRMAPGPRGERIAARWLSRRGYRVLARNLVLGADEADLVACAPDGRTVVIVEVKSRVGDAPPEDRVDRAKQRRLARFATRLEHEREGDARPSRFDVVAVSFTSEGIRVRHIEHAFEAE